MTFLAILPQELGKNKMLWVSGIQDSGSSHVSYGGQATTLGRSEISCDIIKGNYKTEFKVKVRLGALKMGEAKRKNSLNIMSSSRIFQNL